MTQRPILYSSVRSPHCLKVSLVLHEKGVDFERIEVDLRMKEQRTPRYLSINPLGQVPVFEDEHGVHIDSLVIMRYLDDHYGPPRLFPADPGALGEVLAWIELSSTAMRDVSHHLYWQLMEPPGGGADEATVARLKAEGMVLLERVERALEAGDGWLVGGFGAADLSVFAWLQGYGRFGLPPSWGAFPRLGSWLERLRARPSFAASHGAVGRAFDADGGAARG